MQTKDIIFSDDAIPYENCEYYLSGKDIDNINVAYNLIKQNPNIFSINYFFTGGIELSSEEDECRINWTMMIVYEDEVYLQMIEKHTDSKYEVQIGELPLP